MTRATTCSWAGLLCFENFGDSQVEPKSKICVDTADIPPEDALNFDYCIKQT